MHIEVSYDIKTKCTHYTYFCVIWNLKFNTFPPPPSNMSNYNLNAYTKFYKKLMVLKNNIKTASNIYSRTRKIRLIIYQTW